MQSAGRKQECARSSGQQKKGEQQQGAQRTGSLSKKREGGGLPLAGRYVRTKSSTPNPTHCRDRHPSKTPAQMNHPSEPGLSSAFGGGPMALIAPSNTHARTDKKKPRKAYPPRPGDDLEFREHRADQEEGVRQQEAPFTTSTTEQKTKVGMYSVFYITE